MSPCGLQRMLAMVTIQFPTAQKTQVYSFFFGNTEVSPHPQ